MTSMDALLVAVRALHYGATIVLFGEILFALCINRPFTVGDRLPLPERADDLAFRRFRRVAVAAWTWMVISGAGWLVLVTIQMTGASPGVIKASDVATVLGSTSFGQSWQIRALMALLLALIWPILRAKQPQRHWATISSIGMAGGLLAGLAWAGHANAEIGVNGWIQHCSDAAHLLAAGAWLGGLAPLASLLGSLGDSTKRGDVLGCAGTVARFGNWAALCVGVLTLTGLVNAYYLIPGPKTLLETTYGTGLAGEASPLCAPARHCRGESQPSDTSLGCGRAERGLCS